jgi:hypothetical protein
VKRWFRIAGLTVLKGILLFVLLNVVLYVVSLVRRPADNPGPLARYGGDKLQAAYPGWKKADVKTLLSETYRAPEYEPTTTLPFARDRARSIDR